MDEKVKAFINAIGGLAEMCAVLRDSLIANGFTRAEACSLVGTILAETLNFNKK